ncbi:MAG: hypothetical protein ACJ763_02965, partial [Bdellovibrionia bacterium]
RVTKNNPVKWLYPSGALPFDDVDTLASKLVYPEVEAVKLALVNKENSKATSMMQILIRKFLLLRLTAYQRAQDAVQDAMRAQMHSNSELKLNRIDHSRVMQALENIDHVFDTLIGFNKDLFEAQKVYDEAKNLFETELPAVWESLPAQKKGDFKPRFRTDN